ncbi:MAG: hypothetical protein H7Y42_18100 [Chitinophagaceae bacterium]|nr:hypothetical protein [Chitinophagaceae bacterium]
MNITLQSYSRKAAVALFALLALGSVLLFSAFRTQERMTDDVWKMLGISRQSADDKIQNSFINGYLHYYGVKNMKNIAVNDRGSIARDLLTYTKDFIGSSAFRKQYDDMRNSAKPEAPELKTLRTIEQIQKDEIAKTEKSIKDSEKTMKDLPDIAKSLQPLLDLLKKNLKDYQDPKHTYFSAIAMGEKYDQENQIRSHFERTKQWEKNYPENVNDFVADRLKRMLDATKDIDYGAELVEKQGKKIFVKSAYEYKNQEWKQGFRAGKNVTETARAFAQKWLVELKK